MWEEDTGVGEGCVGMGEGVALVGEDAGVGEGRHRGGEEGAGVGEEDAGVGEGDVGVGEGAAMVGEEDAGLGEDAATAGQEGNEVCEGRVEGEEERGRWLAALRSSIGGMRGSWIHGGRRGAVAVAISNRYTTRVWNRWTSES
ncbi:uncharacterized protein [Miscanthus floridulus]|uniref:uncharacterized protein n=1 Tax=Miscanthus floridulus TaxID=154761 RepID=UPI003457F81E